MARKRYSAEQIIGYLREAEVLLAKGRMNQYLYEEWKTNVGQFIDEYNEIKIKCFLLSHASPCFDNASVDYPGGLRIFE
jgi:hypothetical protein